MQAVPKGPPSTDASGPAVATLPSGSAPAMDREFILRNQIVERYIGGRLPLKGAQDFERYCREHPEIVDEIKLTERINAALRLLDASGHAAPWEPPPKRWWEKLPVLIGTAALALVLAITATVLASQSAARDRTIEGLRHSLAAQPLDPAQSTRTITVIPNRTAPSRRSLVAIGGGVAQLADLKFDLSWSPYSVFRVTIDRVDQGRVEILHNVQRDSNGHVRIALNSSALGPGDYQFTIEGLTLHAEAIPQAWATITVLH